MGGLRALTGLAISLLSVLPVAYGWGAPCGPEIRLDSPGLAFSKLPVLDQGVNDFCWSFAGVELAEAWRRSHAGGREWPPNAWIDSPFRVGILGAMSSCPECARHGACGNCKGWSSDAIDFMRAHDGCGNVAILENRLENGPAGSRFRTLDEIAMDLQFELGTSPGSERLEGIFRKLLEHHPDWLDRPGTVVANGRYLFARERGFARRACELLSEGGVVLGPGQLSALDRLAAYLALQSPNGAGAELSRECGRIADMIPPARRRFSEGARDTLSLLDRALSHANPQPVAISFCDQVLTAVRPYRAEIRYRREGHGEISNAWCTDGSNHEALVIGRRANPLTGKCELLVRNSWGTDCTRYVRAGWTCEQGRGQVWVDAEELAKSAYALTWLEGGL